MNIFKRMACFFSGHFIVITHLKPRRLQCLRCNNIWKLL